MTDMESPCSVVMCSKRFRPRTTVPPSTEHSHGSMRRIRSNRWLPPGFKRSHFNGKTPACQMADHEAADCTLRFVECCKRLTKSIAVRKVATRGAPHTWPSDAATVAAVIRLVFAPSCSQSVRGSSFLTPPQPGDIYIHQVNPSFETRIRHERDRLCALYATDIDVAALLQLDKSSVTRSLTRKR